MNAQPSDDLFQQETKSPPSPDMPVGVPQEAVVLMAAVVQSPATAAILARRLDHLVHGHTPARNLEQVPAHHLRHARESLAGAIDRIGRYDPEVKPSQIDIVIRQVESAGAMVLAGLDRLYHERDRIEAEAKAADKPEWPLTDGDKE